MQTMLLAMIPVAVMAVAITDSAQEKPMTIKKMTPNFYTDDVQACVRFWVDRLHFEKTMEVPEGSGLAFAALQKGSIELMYGSYASLEKDAGVSQPYQRGTSFLFIEVEDLDAILITMKGAPIVAPVHKTFYGSTEFTVKDPAGHLITFAQFGRP
jgi:uncharacterized glyoxalase superfamily protein PhnB